MKRITIILGIIVAIVLLLALSGKLFLDLINSTTFQFYRTPVARVETDRKIVALTFDDGPTKGNTEKILQILKDENVTATFFVIGQEIERNPEQARSIAAAGHELGNHSYSHKRMVFQDSGFIANEIEKTDALIRKTGHKGSIHFRPPYGKKFLNLSRYLSEHDRTTIMWDVEPENFEEIANDSKKIESYVVENTRPGSIIILHAMYTTGEESMTAIRPVIRKLKEKGYTFVTVSELLEER